MSGFWGELSLSGARVDPEHSDAMDSAMSYWLPDSANRWNEGPIALGARLLRVTSWDAFDSLPRVESDLVLVGHVRLDDRDTLARDLGREPSTLASTPDSTLVIEAWRKWGESCAQHLYGDWVCAIWNRERRTLWLGRDAAGNTGLYYWHDAGRLVFSTSLKAVLAHPAVPRRPYAYQIARQLAVVSDPAESGSTAWENVRRLPGGHAIRCDLTTVERYEWWHPESLSEITLQTDDEYYQAFREIYSNAVADRLNTARGPVALMLSGGLDSGSVAALAAPRLRTRGERLIAYTSVPRFSPDGANATRMGDEEVLARATANHVGNIEFLPVASVDAGIVASIEEMLRIHDQPQHAASNQYWILEILKLARNRGARVLLTGQGGNATVSWTGYGNLWPSVLRGELSALISAFTKSEVGAWTTMKRQLLKPVLSPARVAWRRLRTRGKLPWATYSAINPRFAKEIDLNSRLRAAGQEPLGTDYSPRHPRAASFRLGRLASAHVGATWMEYGAAYHMDVRDPTRDRRLIEFCWRLPDRVFWANGLRRGLIMKGMRGLLPDDVMHSRLKGLQAADLGHRVLADRKAVVEAIERIEAHPLSRAWLDVARMRSVLDSLQQPITPESTLKASAILLRGLGAGLFLTRF